MGMDLKIRQEGDLLRVVLQGELTLPDAKETVAQLLDTVIKARAKRVLVDCRSLQGEFSTTEDYAHAKFFAERLADSYQKGLPAGTRFGYVLSESRLESGEFGETVAVNRGVNVSIFSSPDEAIDWLGDGEGETS